MSDEVQNETVEQDSPETVALAREMGWKPEAEWRGEPPKGGFTSAGEFVKRGEKILPIVNARARKAEERAANLERELAETRREHRDNLARIERMTTVTLEQQRAQITAEYDRRKEAAVETGDKAAYQQVVKEQREADKAIDAKLAEADDKGKKKDDDAKDLPKEVKEQIDGWLAENPWFNDDIELNALANGRYAKLAKEKPGMTVRQRLDAVREYVAKKYPEQFGEAQGDEDQDDDRPARSRVEGGTRINGGGGRKTTYAQLPADVKAVADRYAQYFLKDGETMEKDGAKAKDRYAAKYFEDQR